MTEDEISTIAQAYHKLLSSLDWNDDVLVAGIREGLSKFLSNAYIAVRGKHKHLIADYYSTAAAERLRSGNREGLVFEHVVPKSEYIQQRCETLARAGRLEGSAIADLLRRYWKIAVITVDEDKKLPRAKMPSDWDGIDVLYRYRKAEIQLLEADQVKIEY